MTYLTILLLLHPITSEEMGRYIFKTPEECSDAMPKYYDTGHDLFCHETEIVSGWTCLLYTSPSPRDGLLSRMPSSA